MNFTQLHGMNDLDDDHEIEEMYGGITRNRKTAKPVSGQKSKRSEKVSDSFDERSYTFTYHASRHEKQWLLASINEFYQQDWVEDILKMVRGGKEASVYLCARPANTTPEFLAAKVYRPRRFRNLKNDHIYREGRDQLDATGKLILDDRSLHAMKKRSSYGLELLHSSWIGHEYRTMELLYDAGVDMPRPYASSDNVILMDYIGDRVQGAPTLNSVSLSKSEARPLFERVLHNIELMLKHNRVHADLSAYNILYWEGDIQLIDFPQAINPDENHNAYRIFARDVERICDYFASQGVKSDASGLARKMWLSRGMETQPSLDPAYLDPENDEDYKIWNEK